MRVPVDYFCALQKQLEEVVNMKNEQNAVVLSGDEKRLEQHVSLLKETVVAVKSSASQNDEEKNLRKYITTEFDSLLKSLKDEFFKNNNRLIDYIYNEHNIALWFNKQHPSLVCMRVEGINVVF